ncbi:hypothetical protein C5L14_16700 [Labrys okinawensis]|uniref:Uncharacterized protein n=1 Tax=Labrys okinawensis TaxID=346911 RepID=A0A2S9QC76_9HYPH|nr:hypothetical protein [Labrys okinawensis]PRH86925.1 hypothetical protein C5L14_16700 [Labrys okinawensis]
MNNTPTIGEIINDDDLLVVISSAFAVAAYAAAKPAERRKMLKSAHTLIEAANAARENVQ